MNEATPSPGSVFLLTNSGSGLVRLLCGCEKIMRSEEISECGGDRTYEWGVEGGVVVEWVRRSVWGESALSSPYTRKYRSESRVP